MGNFKFCNLMGWAVSKILINQVENGANFE
jgi:hypothetical protein